MNGMTMLTESGFYGAVASADFATRYYGLCSRFPIRGIPGCKCTKADVMRILAGMARIAGWCSKDNSYSTEVKLRTGVIHIGFVVQKGNMVEFWFWVEQANQPLGSNYAVIAFEATKALKGATPNPPYPRPCFYTLDDLRDVLAELFGLADAMLTLVKPLME